MAKQTFTTGQVLTAAQMNSLQSNDFNQTVSVKTASYTLVAADKGTRIEFNTSGSVTCTVNTGLFDAGDTLIIQNRGAGAVTVTAGTATVNTSATLVLSQYDAGTLYFVSASAAIFFNTDAGGGSPLTTKGDLFGFSTVDARIPIGADGTVLTADSAQSLGLKWATVASGGETLITTTEANNTASSYDFTSLGTYKHLRFVITKLQTTGTDNRAIGIQFNNDTAGNYTNYSGRNSIGDTELNSNNIALAYSTDGSARYGQFVLEIWNYSSSTEYKAIRWYSAVYTNGTAYSSYMLGHWNSTAAITSVKFNSGSNFRLGTFKVYGIS